MTQPVLSWGKAKCSPIQKSGLLPGCAVSLDRILWHRKREGKPETAFLPFLLPLGEGKTSVRGAVLLCQSGWERASEELAEFSTVCSALV